MPVPIIEDAAVGLALRALRESKNMSAHQLSISSGLPAYTVSRIENGNMKLMFHQAADLTEALGVSLDELSDMCVKLSASPALEEFKKVKALVGSLRAGIKDSTRQAYT